MTEPATRLNDVKSRIHTACIKAARPDSDITLLAVSKTKTADHVALLFRAGISHFGENYLQEALTKIQTLAAIPITWHFIGHIQANKTRQIAAHFHWVQSVASLKVARRLNDQRPDGLAPLNICLQVNIDQEQTKSGISVEETLALAHAVSKLPKLRLRGLMAIPAKKAPAGTEQGNSPDDAYHRMHTLFDTLRAQLTSVDTLSIGMSDDLETAIEHGSTMVRVGRALFGPRT